jgi:acyl transferase domain-containing protein
LTPHTLHGHFIEGVELFDNKFFRISLDEASGMDPQQRWMLEVGYDAFYAAGHTKESLTSFPLAVYAAYHLPTPGGDTVSVTGTHPTFVANRISYVFGLKGASIVINTACSAGLVAAHLAICDLRRGGCAEALPAGVMQQLTPWLGFLSSGMLAPDGHCKTFDASANGYARGEGCVALVLSCASGAEPRVEHGAEAMALCIGTLVN